MKITGNHHSSKGWTFVEMLVAVSLSAIAIGASALVFASISHNAKRLTNLVDVNIGTIANNNFYGGGTDTIRVYSAPNFGTLVRVQQMRDQFIEDLSYSTACFVLPRSGLNTIRPEYLSFPSGVSGSTSDHPQLDSPEAFRKFLAVVEPTSAGIYDTSIRNVPGAAKRNLTIYLLGAITQTDNIHVISVYEIDFVNPSGKGGIYASVRRYKNASITNYYDVYYPEGEGDDFAPGFVAFERQARALKTETTAIDRFKVAPGAPFYFIWFPDPSINPQTKAAWTPVETASSPREAYEQMATKTAFMVVAPMFPSL